MTAIRDVFAGYFQHFGIQLPDPLPDRGQIRQGSWSIRYVVLRDEQGLPCLEFVAFNRFTNPRHERILSSGEIVSLPEIQEEFSYDPKVPGDRDAAQARMIEHNRAVMEDLRRKGLM